MKIKSDDSVLNSIIKNSGIILTGNSTASAFNLASFAIMANQLGPEYLGIFVLCQTYALVINDLFNIQTWESLIKFGASKLSDNSIKSVILTNLALDFISAIFAATLAILLAIPTIELLGWGDSLPSTESIGTYLALYSITILFNLTTLTIGIPRLFRKFISVSIIYSVTAALKLAFIGINTFYTDSLVSYLTIYISFEIITNIALIILSFKLIHKHCGKGWWRDKLSINKEQIRFIWWTNLRTIIRIPVQRLDVIIIGSVMDMTTLGIYKVYKEFAGLISRVGDPVNQAIFPEFAKLIGQQDSQKSIDITKKTMLLLTGVGTLAFLSLLFSAEFLIGQFFGEQYLTLSLALYLMLAAYTISFITVPINSLFIAAGFAKYSFFVLLFTNFIYLISAFSLGYLYGIYGLIIAYTIQLFLNKGFKIHLMKKHPHEWHSKVR